MIETLIRSIQLHQADLLTFIDKKLNLLIAKMVEIDQNNKFSLFYISLCLFLLISFSLFNLKISFFGLFFVFYTTMNNKRTLLSIIMICLFLLFFNKIKMVVQLDNFVSLFDMCFCFIIISEKYIYLQGIFLFIFYLFFTLFQATYYFFPLFMFISLIRISQKNKKDMCSIYHFASNKNNYRSKVDGLVDSYPKLDEALKLNDKLISSSLFHFIGENEPIEKTIKYLNKQKTFILPLLNIEDILIFVQNDSFLSVQVNLLKQFTLYESFSEKKISSGFKDFKKIMKKKNLVHIIYDTLERIKYSILTSNKLDIIDLGIFALNLSFQQDKEKSKYYIFIFTN